MTSVTTTVAFIVLLAVHQVLQPCPLLVRPRYTKLANRCYSFIPAPHGGWRSIRLLSFWPISGSASVLSKAFQLDRHSSRTQLDRHSSRTQLDRDQFHSVFTLGLLFHRYMTSI